MNDGGGGGSSFGSKQRQDIELLIVYGTSRFNMPVKYFKYARVVQDNILAPRKTVD